MPTPSTLRVCDDETPVLDLVVAALQSANAQYERITEWLEDFDGAPSLLVNIDRAREANEVMLSSLRHPAARS